MPVLNSPMNLPSYMQPMYSPCIQPQIRPCNSPVTPPITTPPKCTHKLIHEQTHTHMINSPINSPIEFTHPWTHQCIHPCIQPQNNLCTHIYLRFLRGVKRSRKCDIAKIREVRKARNISTILPDIRFVRCSDSVSGEKRTWKVKTRRQKGRGK